MHSEAVFIPNMFIKTLFAVNNCIKFYSIDKKDDFNLAQIEFSRRSTYQRVGCLTWGKTQLKIKISSYSIIVRYNGLSHSKNHNNPDLNSIKSGLLFYLYHSLQCLQTIHIIIGSFSFNQLIMIALFNNAPFM